MHVILTHEQADFDAVASLLASALLDSRAIPVLPRRMNRNVRAFMNLYAPELPFIEQRDIPAGPIETITLVDTQSMITLKGMTAETRVQVIDHHPARSDPDPNWDITIERLGSTTTYLVESLRERDQSFSKVQASLLLLGIYEDTGSLTYVSTTPRDVRAAAYLLEGGASLRIVNKFLNPPLSSEQRQLYDRLIASAANHTIRGQHVIIAAARAEEMTEEISSIAHKMRDQLDPDSLFILVGTAEGVRLVARSTSDMIDVSKVAAHFGGGGHDRASAALIRTEDLPQDAGDSLAWVNQQLLETLPDVIRPQITVGQIMSNRPRTLLPNTPVMEVSQLMRRYGYEGYPIVNAEGKVVGLLNRRAVDRAISHRLNLPAASLMEAGEVVVHPHDSLEHLQRLMASTGWGQIPVVDPETNQVIGIVTRTDLLKTIGHADIAASQQQNVADRLERALPPAHIALLKLIAELAHQKHKPIYIVGGFVRDLLLNRPSLDFDIVVEGDAVNLAHALEKKYGGRITAHARFGTAKWKIGSIRAHLASQMKEHGDFDPAALPESLDLISARTEFYESPTALPTVERSNIKLDLHRRDFTINTLALRLDGHHYGELYDHWGGMHDIQKRLVRVLHSISFIDDPTRMLRAVRFEQRFDFKIEARTLELVDEARAMLKQVSGDRLRHELDLILSEERAAAMLARSEELGLLSTIHPDLKWNRARTSLLTNLITQPLETSWSIPDTVDNMPVKRMIAYLVWLLPLPAGTAAEISTRLRFPRHMRDSLVTASKLWQELPELPDQKPSQIVERLDATNLPVLYALKLLTQQQRVKDALDHFVLTWRQVHPLTTGDDLRSLGLPPSNLYRRILSRLRAAWLDGEIGSAAEEKALLSELLVAEQ